MKNQLTSFDIHILADELNKLNEARNIRIDKTYQVAEKELKIKINIPGEGSRDLVIAPNYFCISAYPRPAPEKASSFAMQMRKNLKGGFVREIRQHDFDRIVEFDIEKNNKFILIAELFGTGNVVLCDENKKIIGLLEWQRWKDRKLGVNQVYEYPPKPADISNPMDISKELFIEILEGRETRDKNIASVLAKNIGVGGFYAEEICLLSGIDKSKKYSGLSENEIQLIYDNFKKLIENFKGKKTEPSIVYKDEEHETLVDVAPFKFKTYSCTGFETKKFRSFNDAVDEYFSKSESEEMSSVVEKKFLEKLKKLEERAEKQKQAVEKLKRKEEDYKQIGELIYKNFQLIEKIKIIIRNAQKQGVSDKEIMRKIKEAQEQGMEEAKYIRDLKHNELDVEIED